MFLRKTASNEADRGRATFHSLYFTSTLLCKRGLIRTNLMNARRPRVEGPFPVRCSVNRVNPWKFLQPSNCVHLADPGPYVVLLNVHICCLRRPQNTNSGRCFWFGEDSNQRHAFIVIILTTNSKLCNQIKGTQMSLEFDDNVEDSDLTQAAFK